MKLSLLTLSASLFVLMSLTSCNLGGGYDVKEPTREQMLQLDRQWGLPEIQKSKPHAFAPSEDEGNRTVTIQQAPQPKTEAAPAPAPVPEKPKTQEAPPLPDPATLQKLR